MGPMEGRSPRSAGPARRLLLVLLLSLLVAVAMANIEDLDESSDHKEDHHKGHHKDKDDDDDHHKKGHKNDHDDHHKKDDHDDHHKKDDRDDHHKKDDHDDHHKKDDDHKGDHHDDHKNGHKDDRKDGDDDDEAVEHPPVLEEDKEHSAEYDELDSRLNKLTHRLNQIDEELDVRLDPSNHIKGRVLEHRVELLEVDVCADRNLYYCGRADPQCISRLFVCDKIKDCRDGEDEHHCELPTKAGDTFVGHVVWDNCTNAQPDTVSFTVTGVKTTPAFPGFPQLRLTFEVTHEDDEHEMDYSNPTIGYYRFATQNLIALHASEEGLGLICDFDGHDPDRCVGRTVRVSNMEQCAEFIFFREMDEENDDDEEHHHQRH